MFPCAAVEEVSLASHADDAPGDSGSNPFVVHHCRLTQCDGPRIVAQWAKIALSQRMS